MLYNKIDTNRLVVKPEGEPGDQDDHESGDVDGEDVEGELPGKHQVHLEAAVGPCINIRVTYYQAIRRKASITVQNKKTHAVCSLSGIKVITA